ncbi:MAG: translation initiation factor 2, partial [Paracoccaceae bacterium]
APQPDAVGQDEIFLAGMDAPPLLSDPLVLPPPAARGDAPPAEQMPPPPFGTVYQFDAEGRIVPTAEGILTPEGVMLIAGKPARVPPPRPAAIEAAAVPQSAVADAVAEALRGDVEGDTGTDAGTSANAAAVSVPVAPATAEVELQPSETFAADPTLSAARPRIRPEGLAPQPAAEDDASLAPAEDSRFASLRPRLRPSAILAAGEAARKASEAASIAVQVVVAEAAVAPADDANLSPLAVSVSRVPAPRPRDLSRAVEAAVAAATRRAEPEVVVAAAPAPRTAAPKVQADEADDEPDVVAQSAAPRIPTRANVAKQATFVNAINLSKINLIGVYGTQSKRYALVRQPNGRYRKVRVGDSIDGGKVQAITASEVRYQKGGRMLALSLPTG